MAHHIDIRVDGRTRMANQIEELPSFVFDGKEVVIRATLVQEPPAPAIPPINLHDMQARLAAEQPSDPDVQAKYEEATRTGDPLKSRRGGRKRPDPASQADLQDTADEEGYDLGESLDAVDHGDWDND